MTISLQIKNENSRISVTGKFTFVYHREFRESYESALANQEVKTLDIELGGVDYMDSSALGMLLLVKDKAAANNVTLSLLNPKGLVKDILEVANFGQLFTITA